MHLITSHGPEQQSNLQKRRYEGRVWGRMRGANKGSWEHVAAPFRRCVRIRGPGLSLRPVHVSAGPPIARRW